MNWDLVEKFERTTFINFPSESYETVFSVGPACRPAFHLQYNHIRTSAFPLDWQMGYSLDTVIHLLKTNFSDFFLDIREDAQRSKENNCRYVIDYKNQIISMHHFSKEKTLEEGKLIFQKVMKKRADLLKYRLLKSHNVLLLCNRVETVEELKKFLQKFSEIYPHMRITLVNVRHNKNIGLNETEGRFLKSGKLNLYDMELNDVNENGGWDWWKGNIAGWKAILNNINLSQRSVINLNCLQMARIDIKNQGNGNDVGISIVQGKINRMSKEPWFSKNGAGYVLETYDQHLIIELECHGIGNLLLRMQGIDRCVADGTRLPIWVDYTRLVVNDEVIFCEIKSAWHDRPYMYNRQVEDREKIKVEISWALHGYKGAQLAKLISLWNSR